MSENTVCGIKANRNGENWLFCTPLPEEKGSRANSAIRIETVMGPVAWEAQLEPDAEKQTNHAANLNDPIGRPVDISTVQHPPSYFLKNVQKLSSGTPDFEHYQLELRGGEGSHTLTMAPFVAASAASTKLTKERSTLARTHLSDGKFNKPPSLTSRSADRQQAFKIVESPAQSRKEAQSRQFVGATTTKEQSSRERPASKKRNTAKSPLRKRVPLRTFKSQEIVVSGSGSDEETAAGPSKIPRHLKRVASRSSGSEFVSDRSPQKQSMSSINMNKLGATKKRGAVSPLKPKTTAKRPKRDGPFDNDSNSDASSGSKDICSDGDDSDVRMSESEEDDWGSIPVTPAPKRTPVGMNKGASSSAPRPAKVVDVARLRRLLAENTKKQIDSRATSGSTLTTKAGPTTKAEAQGSQVQASTRAGQNMQATAGSFLGRSVLHAQHRGESYAGLKKSETRPATSAAPKLNAGQMKADTASVRTVHSVSASASRSIKSIIEAPKSFGDGKSCSGSPVSIQPPTNKAVGNAKITEKSSAAALKSDRRLGSLIQGIRKSDQPREAEANFKAASTSVQFSEHKFADQARQNVSVPRAQAKQITEGGKPTDPSRRRVLPDQQSRLAGPTLNANKSLNLDSVGTRGSTSQLGACSLNGNSHSTRVGVSKAPITSSVSSTSKGKAEEVASDSVERGPAQVSGNIRTTARPLSSGHMPDLLQLQNNLQAQHPDWSPQQFQKAASDQLQRYIAKSQSINAGAVGISDTANSRTQPKLAATSAVGSQAIPRPSKVSDAFSRIAGSAATKKLRQANASSSSIHASRSMPQNTAQRTTLNGATKAAPSADRNLLQAPKPRVQLPRNAPSGTEEAGMMRVQDDDFYNRDGDVAKVSQVDVGTKITAPRDIAVPFEVPTARMQSVPHVVSRDVTLPQVPALVSQPYSTQAALKEAENVRLSTTRTSNLSAKPPSSALDTNIGREAGHDSAASPAGSIPTSKLLPNIAAKTVATIPKTRKPANAVTSRNVSVPSSSSARVPVSLAITKTSTTSNAPSLGQSFKPTRAENDTLSEAQDYTQKSLGKREEECSKSAYGGPPKAGFHAATNLRKATPEAVTTPLPAKFQVEVDLGVAERTSALATERGLRADTPLSSTASVFILSNSVPSASAEPYFEYCVFQKIWSDTEDVTAVTATELSFNTSTNIDEVNSQAERLFHSLRKEYQQHFQVHFTDWSNKRDDHGCNVLVGAFAPVDCPKKQSHVKIWVQRDHVSAHASQAATNLMHTNFISKTLYVLRLFRLLPSSRNTDSADSDDSDVSDCTATRIYHPHSRTECYTTLDAANRAAKSLQIELSHKPNPNAMDKVWQANNLAELSRKTDELENAKDERSKFWKSEFNGSGLGSATFELRVEKVGLCGPRNL